MSATTFWEKASGEEARAEIERGTSLEAGGDGRSPLHEASAYNTVEVVRLLVVEQKLDVNAQDENGDTPLHLAAESNPDPGIATLLLDQGADVNATNKQGETPLHKAAASSDEPLVVRALLDYGADRDARTNEGHTACWLAVSRDSEYVDGENSERIRQIRRLVCLTD